MADSQNENARPGDEAGRAGAQREQWTKAATTFGDHGVASSAPRKPSYDAQPLIEAGLTLIPLNGKRPRDGRWQLKTYDSAAEVRAAEGQRNIGVRLPPEILVVDADPRNYVDGVDSFAKLAADCGIDLDAYPHVRTGGGGLHVYMHKPKDLVVADKHDRYPGVEFKSLGRQVVAPGSIHPDTGLPYVGVNMALLALENPAPQALLSVVKRRTANEGGGERAGEWTPEMLAKNLARLDPDDFVEYEDWLRVMMAAHHATDGEGLDEFVEWSTQYTGPDAASPELIAEKWSGFRANDQGVTLQYLCKLLNDRGLGVHDRPEPEDDFEQVDDQSTVQRKTEKRWSFLTPEELANLPPPRWLVDGLIQEETIGAIYGPPESFKSFLAIDLILSVASGRPWHGRQVTQGTVLYVAAEGALGLNKRVQAWKDDHGVAADVPFYLMRDNLNLTNEKEAVEFCRQMTEALGKLSMIVIDTLNQTASGADENSATDMGRYIDAMKRMRDASGASVVVIHHSGKDASKGMRGSTALLGAMDTVIEVVRPDDAGVTMNAKVKKQKDAEKEAPFHFEMVNVGDSLVPRLTKGSVRQTDPEFAATSILDWIAAWITERGSAPFKDLLDARMAYTCGKTRATRMELMAVLGDGFGNAKVSSDGVRIWHEREAGRSNGAITVHALKRDEV